MEKETFSQLSQLSYTLSHEGQNKNFLMTTHVRLCECVYTHKWLGHTEKERKQAVNIISGLQAGVHCLSQQIERVLYSSPLCQLKISGSERDFITFIQSGKRKGRLLLWKCACTNYCNHPPSLFSEKIALSVLHRGPWLLHTSLDLRGKAGRTISHSRYIKGPLTLSRLLTDEFLIAKRGNRWGGPRWMCAITEPHEPAQPHTKLREVCSVPDYGGAFGRAIYSISSTSYSNEGFNWAKKWVGSS